MNQKVDVKEIDPFSVPLDMVRALNEEEYSLLLDRLEALHGGWIKGKLAETGAQSIVICDGQVIYTSENRYEPSDEDLEKMEQEAGKPCYVVMGEPPIEEYARWTGLDKGDYYPTLEIYLGNWEWDGTKVFSDGVRLNCDFDTGNPMYAVFNEDSCRAVTKESRRERQGYHLGIKYKAYLRRIKIGIADAKRKRCLEKMVEGVKYWDDLAKNPFKRANPYREGFIGRDLMLRFPIRITLDPDRRESEWVLL